MCRDKLREIKPEPELWIDMGKYSLRDEVVISRMRLGHTLLTHGYLTDNDVPDVAPHCELCNNPPPRHLLGSHTVLGISVPGGVNFALFMAYSFCYKYS